MTYHQRAAVGIVHIDPLLVCAFPTNTSLRKAIICIYKVYWQKIVLN